MTGCALCGLLIESDVPEGEPFCECPEAYVNPGPSHETWSECCDLDTWDRCLP